MWYVMHKTSQFLFSSPIHCVAKYFMEMCSVFVMALHLIPIFIHFFCPSLLVSHPVVQS